MASVAAEPTGRKVLRVLWLIDSLTMGGAESLVGEIAGARDDSPFTVQVCCLKTIKGNPIEEELRRRGVACLNLQARNLRDVRKLVRLVRVVKKERYDVVHSHLTYASIWGALASRFSGTPHVASLHVRPPSVPIWTRDGMRHWLMCSLLEVSSERVIAVSEALRRRYADSKLVGSDKMIVVHNGVDFRSIDSVGREAALDFRLSLRIPQTARVVSSVSVLRPEKGLHVLLEAVPEVLAQHADTYFLIVGDGPVRSQLADAAAAMGVDERVRFLNFRRDVPTILRSSDIFVHPSLEDAFPTVLLEAMAARLPIVATDVGGIPEIVQAPKTGRLVPAGDSAALKEAINALLVRPEILPVIGENGRQRARQRFSVEAWIARLESVYREALSDRKRISLATSGGAS